MNTAQAIQFVKLDHCPDDACDHELCHKARAGMAKLQADARALWAVRVLRASALEHAKALHVPGDVAPGVMLLPITDAGALTMAEAVYPKLPESVRKDLGERP